MKRITTISAAALVALGSTAAATIPAASAPTPKVPTVSVTISDDTPLYCFAKWSVRGLEPNTEYVLIINNNAGAGVSPIFTTDSRGTAKGSTGVDRPLFNNTYTVTTRLFPTEVPGAPELDTNSKVANRCAVA